MTDIAEIEKKLLEIISEINEDDDSELTPSTLISNINIDSLDVVSMIFDIEEYFEITIEDSDQINDRLSFGTISDLAGKILEKLSTRDIEESCES
jgi:acyl carrier protein